MIFNSISAGSTVSGAQKVLQKNRPVSPGHLAQLLQTTNRDGTFFLGKDRNPLLIPVQIYIKGESKLDRREKARKVAAWLDTDDVAPLIFLDDPDVQYQAICLDPINIREMLTSGVSNATFFVPSSYGESTTTKTASPNAGTAKTPAEITVTMTSASATLKVTLDETGEYVLLTTTLAISDEIIIDTNKHTVTLNGADAREYVSFYSTYFSLPVGAFTLTPLPASSTVAVVFRERYK